MSTIPTYGDPAYALTTTLSGTTHGDAVARTREALAAEG